MKNDIGNAMGNRIAKHVFDDEWNLEKSTYYVLDAQGNQMSMYEHVVEGETVNYNLAERNIYGSSQIGTLNSVVDMYDENAPETEDIEHFLGKKFYSLSNHLGNVLTVISDQKIPLDQNNDQEVDGYLASIVNVSDYSPFGVELDGRTISNGDYRYGFQGQESDDEVKGDGNSVNYKYRMHDPRVGRFFAVDPLAPQYPWNSTYAFSANCVINSVELEGLEAVISVTSQWYYDKMAAALENGNQKELIRLINRAVEDKVANFKKDDDGVDPIGFVVLNQNNAAEILSVSDGLVYNTINDFTRMQESVSDANSPENGTKELSKEIIDKQTQPKEVTSVNSEASLASDLMNSGKVSVLDFHTSGEKDNANAQQNLLDAGEGKKIKRSSYGTAPGGSVDMSKDLLIGLSALSEKYTFRITEIAGGSHSGDSRHYLGVAVDIDRINGKPVNKNNPDYKQFMVEARKLGFTEVLGPGDEHHSTHIHIAMPRNAE